MEGRDFEKIVENEVLFEKWWDFLCYDRELLEEDDFMSTWEDAKNIAISVLGSKKALLMFRREITHLRSSMNNPFCNFYMLDFDSVLCCATTMIIISGKKDEFDGILDEFKQVYLSQANEIAKYAADLIERIKAGEIKKDYDYSKVDGSLKECEDSNSEDVICVDSKIRQTATKAITDEAITKTKTITDETKTDETKTDETKTDETETITKADAGTAENNETLLEELTPIFYGNKEQAEDYIKKIKNITKDVEKIRYTAQLVNENTISEMSCHRDLYSILHDHRLYNKSESNWNKVISQYLVKK